MALNVPGGLFGNLAERGLSTFGIANLEQQAQQALSGEQYETLQKVMMTPGQIQKVPKTGEDKYVYSDNTFHRRKMTFKEELQADVDSWLSDVEI